MHISLIVPAPFDAISGGYEYDRRIAGGLRELDHTVDIVELPGAFPLCDAVAQTAARDALNTLPAGTIPVIDGLALPAFQGLETALSARRAAGLIHHPVSLETGLDTSAQASRETAERGLFAALAHTIGTSETTAETLATRFGLLADRIATVVPGTDDAPRCHGSGAETVEILSIGTLIPRKGHDLLLRALARLWDLDWHLTIAGASDRDQVHAHGLMALTEELNLGPRVRFAGEVTGQNLKALWRGADIFALATHYEGYGMAIAEALKRGIPPVVTAGGAAGNLLTPDSGCVCPPGDRDQLSKSLRRLIFGDGLRAEMAEAAWRIGQTLPSWPQQSALFAQSLG